MEVEHKMAELNTTWRDLLKELASSLNWSYAVLWTRTDDGRNLVWKQGYFHTRSNDDVNDHVFHTFYSECTFLPGFGFAGQLAQGSDRILWLTGDEFDSVPHPVPQQTLLLRNAGIQTVVCLPLDLPSSSFVLELGTVSKVLESDNLGQNIKTILLHIRAGGLSQLLKDTSVTDIPADSNYGLTVGELPIHVSMSPPALGSEIIMDPARTAAMDFSPSTRGPSEEMLLASQRRLQSSIYSELMQPINQEDTFLGQSSRVMSDLAGTQRTVGIPDLPTSSGVSPREGFESQWAIESALLPVQLNPYHSWVETSTMDAVISAIPSISSGMAARAGLGGQAANLNDQLRSFSSIDQFMTTASGPQHHHQDVAIAATATATATGRGDAQAMRRLSTSPSSSPVNRRSQTGDDSAMSATILESSDRFRTSELEAGLGVRVSSSTTAVAGSSTALPTEAESYNWPGVRSSSGQSSKETSPDDNVPMSRHLAIDMSSTSYSQAQRQLLGKQHSTGFPASGASQRSDHLEQHFPQNPQPQEQYAEGLKPIQSSGDSSPMLVQFGNVLQLGNAAGQVTEALPQQHDEAAVSHMLAERRRRIKQNENFTQLKSLIPSAAKMDKATLLAATIQHINELKDRVKELEQSNEKLKRQLEQPRSPKEGLLRTSSRGKGSPPKSGVRGPGLAPPSSADVDRIQVSPDGEGNLHIEIRCPCNQPDSAMTIFACLTDMHFKIINANVDLNDNRIYATIMVKMKRKHGSAQSEVCAEVEQALKICLNII